MVRINREKKLEARVRKLERKLRCKNESTGPWAVALYEAIGEGLLRWKDVCDEFLAQCDDSQCQEVAEALGLEIDEY